MTNFGAGLFSFLIELVTRLNMTGGSTPQVTRKLLANEADIAVSSDLLERDEAIRSIPLMREDFLLVINKKVFDRQRPNSWVDLREYLQETPYARTGLDTMDYFQTERMLRAMDLTNLNSFEINSCFAHLGAVAKGTAWSILPVLSVIPGARYLKDVEFIPVPGKTSSRSFFLSYKDRKLDSLAERIAEEVRRLFKTEFMDELKKDKPELLPHIKLL